MSDDEVPSWALPLVRGPIEVNEHTVFDELAGELAERLDALLTLNGFEATPDGWRALALRLALDHEIVAGKPAMRIITPVDRRDGTGGAEPGKNFWQAMRLRKRAKKLGSVKAAAKEMARKEKQSIGRLQNLHADAVAGRAAKPKWLERLPWEEWIDAALAAAADRIEVGHKSEHLFS